MNSITKIGKMYLTKYFSQKPNFSKDLNEKWFTKVIFSKNLIDLSVTIDLNFIQAYPLRYRFYKIWSGEIGILSLDLKKGQTLLKGIVRKLNKLQKEDAPSHIIVGERTQKDGITTEVTITYTIYRLTDYQELLISNDYLFPCMKKRDKKLQEKSEKEYLEYQKYLEKCKLEEEKNLEEFEVIEEEDLLNKKNEERRRNSLYERY